MFDDLKKQSTLLRILLILLIIAVGVYVLGIVWQILGLFSDVLIILAISWLLSFILEPLVERINKYTRLSRTLSTGFIYIFTAAIIITAFIYFIPVIVNQIQALSKTVPGYLETAPPFIKNWGESILLSLNNSVSLLPSIAQFLFSMLLVFIISFYLLVDKEKIRAEFYYLIPKKWHDEMKFVQSVVESTFSSFLRVQLIFGVVSGLTTWIVLRIAGVDFAASTSLLSGIFAIIPLVGPILAIIPPVLIALIFDPARAFIVFIILLIAQQFIFNVLGSKLFGKALKLNPIIILISFLIGARIGGGIGAIFAIPIIGILAVIIREISHYFIRSEK